MATFVNAPWTLKITAAAANTGNIYDYQLDTSTNRYSVSWRNAATPIHAALLNRTYPAVHWRITVYDLGYSTPIGLFPYSPAHRVVLSGTCGAVEVSKGLQSFADLVENQLDLAKTLATPVV